MEFFDPLTALARADAELSASRAREAKLVEALRDCLPHIEWTTGHFAYMRVRELLALYDTPAEMPSDVHPQGE